MTEGTLENIIEGEPGLTAELAIDEAKRCLSCRKCLGCGLCLAECHARAINFEQPDEEIEITVNSVVLAPGLERSSCPAGIIVGHGKYPNVVTAGELESMLSDEGVSGGLVIRPYDGEIPRMMAFVQRSSDGDSLTYAARLATAAYGKGHGLETHVFVDDSGFDWGESSEASCKALPVAFRTVHNLSIQEVPDSRNLILEFSEHGDRKRLEFDLVVLISPFKLSEGTEELGKQLGVALGKSYWEIGGTSLVKTVREGVFLTGYVFSP